MTASLKISEKSLENFLITFRFSDVISRDFGPKMANFEGVIEHKLRNKRKPKH